jgi:MinD superfamily P-loop ATPase
VIRIAVASGKGGTGKTTMAANLTFCLAEAGAKVAYVDCDVEEPNGHIFLKPVILHSTEASIPVPVVDKSRCILCGVCGDACRFSAIVALPKSVMTFPKLCHGCGGCTLACAAGAIVERPRVTGVVEQGVAGQAVFIQGRLHVGEAMAPPVIREVLKAAPKDGVVIMDAPPGTSCPVMETVKQSDVVLLVTEPTPFGLNDLKIAVDMVRALGVPFGVAINRSDVGNDEVLKYCEKERIEVLITIKNDRAIAEAYSEGKLAANALPKLKPKFLELFDKLVALADDKDSTHSKIAALSLIGNLKDCASERQSSSSFRDLSHIQELVVISGKGGTGKTGIAASFFVLAKSAAAADCDVDAADMHLILQPSILHRYPFSGKKRAVIDKACCTKCGECMDRCRFDAICAADAVNSIVYEVDPFFCEGCGVCMDTCSARAVSFNQTVTGEWMISETRFGPLAHARLGIAEENGGKLVSLVRRKGLEAASGKGRALLICDGSPGIGCPVISSTTGATMALIVTEPTLSGLHDMKRVADLCRGLNVKAGLCVNKADINLEVAARIESEAKSRGIPVLGRVRYDEAVTRAQVNGLTVVEDGNGPAATDIRALFEKTMHALRQIAPHANLK